MSTIYFFGENNKYGYLSNFYNCQFSDENYVYSSTEQYFMKKKQEFFDPSNTTLSENIMSTTNPKVVKSYGRKVKNFDEKKWNDVCCEIMKKGLYHKFTQNKDLETLLLNTENNILAEASPYDKKWGIGINVKDAYNGKDWKGKNLLGNCLMEIRDRIRKEKIY